MSKMDDMDGGNSEDRVLVAEYVLGLLDPEEHAAVARRLKDQPELAAEQQLWRSRFASLDDEFADTPAPAEVLPKIEARLFGETAVSTGITNWWNSLFVWRSLAGAAAAIAVVAVGINLMQPRLDVDAVATQLVAAIQAQEGSGVEFVAFYDTTTQTVRLVGVEGQQVPDHDFELWYIEGDAPAVSMGVIPVDGRREIPLDDVARENIGEGTVFAVTLEQKGGSPTGVAQGPIVAVGKATSI